MTYEALSELIKKRQLYEANCENQIPIANKTDLNYADANNKTLLDFATSLGDKKRVKDLLDGGAIANKSIMLLALNKGLCDIADLYYDSGVACVDISLSEITNQSSKKWFRKKIEYHLSTEPASLLNKSVFWEGAKRNKQSQLFISEVEAISGKTGFSKLFREIEIGKLKISDKEILAISNIEAYKYIPAVITAGDWELLKILEEKRKLSERLLNKPKDNFLFIAAESKEDKFFSKMSKIDEYREQRNSQEQTPLMNLAQTGDEEGVKALLDEGADILALDCNGRNVLHHAVASNTEEIVDLILKSDSRAVELLSQRSVFGDTPAIYAAEFGFVEMAKKLDSQFSLEEAEPNRIINQGMVIQKMRYYLRSQYRDESLFSDDGNCNGFAFLYEYYCELGLEKQYFSTMAALASWNGEDGVITPAIREGIVGLSSQKENLTWHELFEQWINDTVWFQHSNLDSLYSDRVSRQNDRRWQMSVAGDKLKPISISHAERVSVSLEELIEDLSWIKKNCSPGTRFIMGGGRHAVAFHVNDDDSISYYDSNNKKPMANSFFDIKKLAFNIYQNKYQKLGMCESDGKISYNIHGFYFFNSELKSSIIQKNIFEIDSLLTDKAIKEFIDGNLSQSTPLHLAVRFGARENVKKLLECCPIDIASEDKYGFTALDYALSGDDIELTKILLNAHPKNISMNIMSKRGIAYVLSTKREYLFEVLLDYPDIISHEELYKKAVSFRCDALANLMIERNLIDLTNNKKLSEFCTDALTSGCYSVIGSIIKMLKTSSYQAGEPLRKIVAELQKYVENQLFWDGEAALAITNLMESCPKQYREDAACQTCLLAMLKDAVKHDSVTVTKIILRIIPENEIQDFLKTASKGKTPFLHAVLNNNFEMMELLRLNGADIDALSSRGNTALHYAIVTKNKPLVSWLINVNARTNIPDASGSTVDDLLSSSSVDAEIKSLFSDIKPSNENPPSAKF